MVTREWLLEQLNMYTKQKENALAIASANQGAVEAIQAVLKQMDEEVSLETEK